MFRYEIIEWLKYLLDDEMNFQFMLCFLNFFVYIDVCVNCFQFMLIDVKDKIKICGEGIKIILKYINMLLVWNFVFVMCVEKML